MDVQVLKEKRGTRFSLSDTKPYFDAVEKMAVADGQSAAVIINNLHNHSVKTHFDVLSGLTGYVLSDDDPPFVEYYQTPAIL